MDHTTSDPVFSEPMRRVLEAMVAGEPVPTDAHAALNEEERREVASLARTAHVTRIALNRPEPTQEMEAKALARAQATLAARPASASPAFSPARPPAPGSDAAAASAAGYDEPEDETFFQWLGRLFGKRR